MEHAASYVIRRKDNKKAVGETFNRKRAVSINAADGEYEAVPIRDHLASLNTPHQG